MEHDKAIEAVRHTEVQIQWFGVATIIFLLLAIPAAPADQQPITLATGDTPMPTVSATQQPPVKNPPDQTGPITSVDFLMAGPSTTRGIMAQQHSVTQAVPGTTPVAVLPSEPMDIKADEVAVLVSEQCKQTGDNADGSISCSRIYSNGHHAKVLSQLSYEGDEFKQQAVIEEYDKGNNLLSKKTIRHRVDYNYLNDQRAKEQELFDITCQSEGKKTTRELMVYQFHLNTGKPKVFSWTQYKQVGNKAKAGLTYHASLGYAADGSPDRGIAEQWDQGKKVATFLNWSRIDGGLTGSKRETWTQWESWIKSMSLQAYLP